MKFIDTLQQIERIDQLIRLKATGSPKDLSLRLNISESTLYQLLNTMKDMGAPIYFCRNRNSYCYDNEVRFEYGFILPGEKEKKIFGGKEIVFISTPDFLESNNLLLR